MASSAASRAVKGAVRRLGFDLVRRHYYSPIPDLDEIPPDVWTRQSELRGLDFDPEAMLAYVERQLSSYLTEYTPQLQPSGDPRDFYLENGYYESVDAETLYAMVRRLAPRRVVELGSGMSTLVIGDARARSGDVGDRSHVVFDPLPRPELAETLAQVGELSATSAHDVPLSEFERLEAGDVLFIDTTHTVKVGGEVNRIVLDVLPVLAPGVHVHIHDIYLPWEYPREFLTERSFFWAEQFLVQAFLAFNREFEILFGTHVLQRLFPEEVAQLIPSARPGIRPSALWLRRTES
jgi:methyltransferase family protein